MHATTRRVVNEAFAEERPHLRPLPLAPFHAVLRLERRISRDGMVSVGGNLYSVPDATRRRAVEVHTLADEVRIFEDGVADRRPSRAGGPPSAPRRARPSQRAVSDQHRRRWPMAPWSSAAPATRSPSARWPFYDAVARQPGPGEPRHERIAAELTPHRRSTASATTWSA